MEKKIDISKLSSFATLLFVGLLVFVFTVNGYNTQGALDAYSPLQRALDSWANDNPYFAIAINAFCVAYGAVILGRYGVRYYLYPSRCYLAAIFFVMLSMAMGCGSFMLRVYVTSFILILAVGHIFKGSSAKRITGYRWFVCGFWIAVASLIFSGAVFAILAIIVGLMIYRMNAPKEYAIAFAGFFMVIVLVWSFYIIIGYGYLQFIEGFAEFVSLPKIPLFEIKQWAFIGLTAGIVVLSIVQLIKIVIAKRADLVKGVLFFVILLLLCSLTAVFTQLGSISAMPIIAIPVSVIMPLYFASSKKRLGFKNLIFFIYFIVALIQVF